MLTGVLTARFLGPAAKGQLTSVLTWSQIATFVCMLGITNAVTVRVAESGADGLRTSVGNALAFSALIGGMVATVGWFVLPDLLHAQGPGIGAVAHLAVLTAPFVIAGDLLSSAHLALRRVARYSLYRLVVPAAGLVAVPLLLATDALTPRAFLVFLLIGSVSAFALAVPGLQLRRARLDLAGLGADLRFGLKAYAAQLMALLNVRLDLLVVSVTLGATQVGIYGAANSVMVALTILPGAAALLILPALASAGAAGVDLRSRLLAARRSAVVQLAVAAALALALFLAAEPLVRLLLGPAYLPTVPLMRILAPAYALRAYTAVLATSAVGLRRPWVGSTAEGSALVLTLALLPVLLRRYGVQGAAITSLVAYTASALVAGLCWQFLLRRSGPGTTGEPTLTRSDPGASVEWPHEHPA